MHGICFLNIRSQRKINDPIINFNYYNRLHSFPYWRGELFLGHGHHKEKCVDILFGNFLYWSWILQIKLLCTWSYSFNKPITSLTFDLVNIIVTCLWIWVWPFDHMSWWNYMQKIYKYCSSYTKKNRKQKVISTQHNLCIY
jgi:hypothetical protein